MDRRRRRIENGKFYCKGCEKWKLPEEFYFADRKLGYYQSRCKECSKQQSMAARRRSPEWKEKQRQYNRRWRERHPNYHHQHYLRHKKRYTEYSRQRRARIAGVELTMRPEELEQLRVSNDRCAYCGHFFDGEEFVPSVEHVIPISKGGGHIADNLLMVCMRCNRAKGSRLLGDWMPFDWYSDGIHRFAGKGESG